MQYRNPLRIRAIVLLLGILVFVSPAHSQITEPAWQRVTTGEDFTVDVDTSSLVFKTNRVLEARFRTEFSKSETLPGSPGVKYKSRLDTIQFSTADYSYRISQINLLDSKSKVVHSEPASDTKEWKPIKGSAHRWFAALEGVSPLNAWTVNSYRFVGPDSRNGIADSDELTKLLGSRILFAPRYAHAGDKLCRSVSYESRKLTDKDLEELLGASIEGLGVTANPIDVIALKCETKEWQPEQSLLIRVSPVKMLMLWDGVFLELLDKRPKRLPIPIPNVSYDSPTRSLEVNVPGI